MNCNFDCYVICRTQELSYTRTITSGWFLPCRTWLGCIRQAHREAWRFYRHVLAHLLTILLEIEKPYSTNQISFPPHQIKWNWGKLFTVYSLWKIERKMKWFLSFSCQFSCPLLHKCTHTPAYAYTRVRAHAHTRIFPFTHTSVHTRTHSSIHTYTLLQVLHAHKSIREWQKPDVAIENVLTYLSGMRDWTD